MKKLLAILLSVLMLCTMIPFATVSASDEATIEIYVEETELNAGDEFEVVVNLLNIPDPGLIGVLVKLEYDHDAMDLVWNWDEDEEDYVAAIEIGSKYNASSNKYITIGPQGSCNVNYMRATAKETQTRYEEHFYTATFKIKDDAVSGDYTIGVLDYNPKNIVRYGNLATDFAIQAATITVNGAEPTPPACEHEYTYACDKICALCGELTNEAAEHNIISVEAADATCYENGNVAYTYCDICGSAWLADGTVTNLKSVVVPGAHNVIHVEAVEATCDATGNVEYWYCDVCGSAWLDADCTQITNLKNVITPVAHNIIHVEAVDATCYEPGNIEYWYCDICGAAWTDELCREVTNLKNVVLPISHNIIHVEAVEATCYEPGNVEYWYCDACGSAWLDETCYQVTNLKNVVLPISHNIIHVEAVEATCYEPGNVEYWYCDACGSAWLDETCYQVTNLKNVVLPISHNVIHVEAKDASCTENGNIEYWYCDACGSAWLDELCHLNTNLKAVVLGATGHDYDDDMDVDCNVCGDIRVIDYVVKTFGGTSMAESNDGLSGLAFRFDLTDKIEGLAVVENTLYVADYSNAYVTPNTTGTYKLVSMGAKVFNGVQTKNVAVKKVVLSETESFYAIRIVNIPEAQYGTEITCTPYFVYENAEGELVTVYGEAVSSCVNDNIG